MQNYDFRIILSSMEVMTDDAAERLYEAGCDDATFGSSELVAFGIFHRDANSLEEAIRSAIADVQKAGFQVARVEPDEPCEFARINLELTRPN